MIIRRKITSNFTVIPNEVILDTRLSAEARWLLSYLLSRPNDWQVQVKDIQNKGCIGREKAYRLIKELVSVGWVRKDVSRENGGKWGGVDYVVMDQPECENLDATPFPEKPHTAEPDTAKQHLTKNLEKQNTEKVQKTDLDISYDADFAEFWAAYPKRPNNSRKKAMAAYSKARKKTKVTAEVLLTAVKAYAAYRAGEDPQYTALTSTWLNEERWECDYTMHPKTDRKGKTAEAALASEAEIGCIVSEYPGNVSDREEAKRILAAELAKGVKLEKIIEAAEKYALYVKEMKYRDTPVTPPILELWMKFKWREMDAYVLGYDPLNGKLRLKAARR